MARISLAFLISALFAVVIEPASAAEPLESMEEVDTCDEDACDVEAEWQRVSMLQVNSQISRTARARLESIALEVEPESLLQEGSAGAQTEVASSKVASREAARRIFSGSLLAPNAEQALLSLKRHAAKLQARKAVRNGVMLPVSLEAARASKAKSQRPLSAAPARASASAEQSDVPATVLASVESAVQPAVVKGTRVASRKATKSIFAGSLFAPEAQLADQVLKRHLAKTHMQKLAKSGFVLPSYPDVARQATK